MYQKGPEFITGAYKLPNVGGPAHTYLTHIINHYDDLAEHTVFLNNDVQRTDGVSVEELCDDTKDIVVGSLCTLNLRSSRHLDESGYLKDTGVPGHIRYMEPMQSASLPFGQWFNRAVAYGREDSFNFEAISQFFLVTRNSNFSVRRDCIHDKPKHYYQSLLNWISAHPNPEWAKYMNHAWLYIFMPTHRTFRVGLAGDTSEEIRYSAANYTIPPTVLAKTYSNFRRAS
jgi:hypothetical protein